MLIYCCVVGCLYRFCLFLFYLLWREGSGVIFFYSPPYLYYKWVWFVALRLDPISLWCRVKLFVFLIVEEESARPTHHLPVGFAMGCFFASALAPDCRQVVAHSSSRNPNFPITAFADELGLQESPRKAVT
jgi:hypothetical protein